MFHPQGPTFWELAAQALSSTARGYDLLAPKFDYTPFRTPDAIVQAAGAYLASLGGFDSGLDLCCGTGAGMRMLRPLCRDRVVGVDFSQGMLAVGRRKTADAPGTAALEFIRGDALALPFAAAFDVAVCFGAFGHVLRKDQARFVGQVARALRPGGRFVFVTAPRPPFWSAAHLLSRAFNGAMHLRNLLVAPPFVMFYLTFLLPEVKALLEAHGFDVEVRDPGLGGPWSCLRLVSATRRPCSLA